MRSKFDVQVPKDHYYDRYDSVARFISYFYQVDLVRQLGPKKVLEIGVGNKTVSNYLKQSGISVDTCDFDEALEPDFIADIRQLPFENNVYDVVMACEVIEHIPWDDVEKALSELHRISSKYVLISVPYCSIAFDLVYKIPVIGKVLKKPFFNFFLRIPYRFKDIEFSREHYWEIGRKSYPIKKVRSELKKYFRIMKERRPILNHYNHFFMLEKK